MRAFWNVKNIKKLISYYEPYKKALFIDLVCTTLAGVVEITVPLIARYITIEFLKFETKIAIKYTTISMILVVILLLVSYFCTRVSLNLGRNIADSISKDMRLELFKHYQKQSFDFFDENKTGKLASAMYVDISSLSEFLSRTPEFILELLIRFIGASFIFFSLNIRFSIIIFLILGIVVFYINYFTPTVQEKSMKNHEKISDINGYIEESLSGIRITQSLNNEDFEYKKMETINKEYLDFQKSINKTVSLLSSGLKSLAIGVVPMITIISMFFVINGTLTVPDLITYILYTGILMDPIMVISGILLNYQEAIAGYKRFIQMIEIKPTVTDLFGAVNLCNVRGNVEFKNVSFNYAKSKGEIFKNLSLKINSGEYVALIGTSGIGKSTLCSLIPRFYDVTSGEVLIDNVNVKNICLHDLRSNIGFVHQDAFLFSGTIIENIRYGKPEASYKEVINAAKNAFAHDFITKSPDGYNTQVGERGFKLSGGQKQRIAIARIFLKNPPILIFDEATSNLDDESEHFIQKSMEKLAKNRTTIVIAHRLSTIKNAERILVLKEGKIVEKSKHIINL